MGKADWVYKCKIELKKLRKETTYGKITGVTGQEQAVMMKAMQPAIANGKYVSNKYYFDITAQYNDGCCDENPTVTHALNVVPVVNPQFFGFDNFHGEIFDFLGSFKLN